MATKNEKTATKVYEDVTINEVVNVFAENEINLRLSEKVRKIDVETKEEKQNNVITLKLKNLQNQLADKTPLIGRLVRRSLGRRVNPEILGVLLTNAVVTLESVFFKEGDLREDGETKYTTDGYKYVITALTLHLDDYAKEDYAELIATQPYLQDKENNTKQKAVANWILEAMK